MRNHTDREETLNSDQGHIKTLMVYSETLEKQFHGISSRRAAENDTTM